MKQNKINIEQKLIVNCNDIYKLNPFELLSNNDYPKIHNYFMQSIVIYLFLLGISINYFHKYNFLISMFSLKRFVNTHFINNSYTPHNSASYKTFYFLNRDAVPSPYRSKAVPSSLPLVLSPEERAGSSCHFPQMNSAEFGPLILLTFLTVPKTTVFHFIVFRINILHAIKCPQPSAWNNIIILTFILISVIVSLSAIERVR